MISHDIFPLAFIPRAIQGEFVTAQNQLEPIRKGIVVLVGSKKQFRTTVVHVVRFVVNAIVGELAWRQ